jgi:hypothetical protein
VNVSGAPAFCHATIKARGAVGVGLERDRAAVHIAEDGGFGCVGGELQSDDLAGAIDIGGREGDAEIFGRGRGEESGAEERCDEEGGGLSAWEEKPCDEASGTRGAQAWAGGGGGLFLRKSLPDFRGAPVKEPARAPRVARSG